MALKHLLHKNFLEHVRPQLAIISVGKYNSFGHPSKEVLDRLNNLPTKILRTDEKRSYSNLY